MTKHRPLSKIICLFILLLSLSGCWDQREIEKRAYVVAIGLDKAEQENSIKVTYLIANPEVGSQQQGGGTSESPVEIISFVTHDFITARNTANAVIAKQVTYDLLETMFVSEEFAKDDDYIRWMYDATKGMEIKRSINFVVTKEQTSKFIMENNPKLETRPHKYFNQILTRGMETGLIPTSDLLKFFRVAEADADLFLAVYGTTEKKEQPKQVQEEDNFKAGGFYFEGKTNKTNFAGSAVFKEGKMIGKLTGEETRISILLNDTIAASDILATYPDPFNEKYQIATRIVKKRDNSVKMDFKNGTPKIDVTIPLKVEVLSNHSMVNYAQNKENREKLKKSIKEKITKKIEKLVKKTQEELKGEPFGWSLIARKQFLTIPEYESFNWMKSYPDMKIDINVKIELSAFGRQGELPSKKEMRD